MPPSKIAGAAAAMTAAAREGRVVFFVTPGKPDTPSRLAWSQCSALVRDAAPPRAPMVPGPFLKYAAVFAGSGTQPQGITPCELSENGAGRPV